MKTEKGNKVKNNERGRCGREERAEKMAKREQVQRDAKQ